MTQAQRFLYVFFFASLFGWEIQAQRYSQPVFEFVDSLVNVQYGIAPDFEGTPQTLLLDFYEPQGDAFDQRPLIVYIHGGGFTSGSRKLESIRMICEDLAQRGYVVASIDYRLDPNFDLYDSEDDRRAMTDAMHDARAAVRYFRANAETYRIDPEFIVIGGESAGAATALLTGYTDTALEVSEYPMANPNNVEGASGNEGFSSEVSHVLALCGIYLTPEHIATPTDVPMLWVHSDMDSFVPLALAQLTADAAENAGIPLSTHIFAGQDHCPWYYLSNDNWENYLDSTVTFIAEFLAPKLNLSQNDLIAPNELTAYKKGAYLIAALGPVEEYRIFSIEGKIVAHGTYPQNGLDLSNLSSGLYVLRARNQSVLFLW